jgi:hypothetical protein
MLCLHNAISFLDQNQGHGGHIPIVTVYCVMDIGHMDQDHWSMTDSPFAIVRICCPLCSAGHISVVRLPAEAGRPGAVLRAPPRLLARNGRRRRHPGAARHPRAPCCRALRHPRLGVKEGTRSAIAEPFSPPPLGGDILTRRPDAAGCPDDGCGDVLVSISAIDQSVLRLEYDDLSSRTACDINFRSR